MNIPSGSATRQAVFKSKKRRASLAASSWGADEAAEAQAAEEEEAELVDLDDISHYEYEL